MIYSPALKVQTQIQPRYVKCHMNFFFFIFLGSSILWNMMLIFCKKKISLASNKSYRGYSYWWQTILVLTPSFCKQGWEEQNKSKSKEVPTFFNLWLVCQLYLKLKYIFTFPLVRLKRVPLHWIELKEVWWDFRCNEKLRQDRTGDLFGVSEYLF